MATQIQDIGNGNGYLYVVDQTGVYILRSFKNSKEGARRLRLEAAAAAVLPYQQQQINDHDLNDIYNTVYGLRFYIQANYTTDAEADSLTNAVEITKHVIARGMETARDFQAVSVSSGAINPARNTNDQVVQVDTEADAATDVLDFIGTTGFVHGDKILLVGENAARPVTVTDANNATSENAHNIELTGDNNFVTGDRQTFIELMLYKPPLEDITPKWVEVHRSFGSSVAYTYGNFRADGTPEPKPGVEQYALLASQAVQEREAGVDEGIIEITGSGVTLTGSFVLQAATSPSTAPIAGDTFRVVFLATGTDLNGNAMTIFGQNITQAMLDASNFGVLAHYNGSSWEAVVIPPNSLSPFYTPIATTGSATLRGTSNIVTGDYSFAQGESNVVTGDKASAQGESNAVSGDRSQALGYLNTISGAHSQAAGEQNNISGDRSFAANGGHDVDHNEVFAHGRGSKSHWPLSYLHGDNKGAAQGFQQWVRALLQANTSDATPTKLQINDNGSLTDLVIPVNTAFQGKLHVMSQKFGGGGSLRYSVSYEIELAFANFAGTLEWIQNPIIVGKFRRYEEESGTAQAGAASTITLAAGAKDYDDAYNDIYIKITGGTGAGQIAKIVDYVGSTKVATIDGTWSTNPDATSTYELYKGKFVNGTAHTMDLDVAVNDTTDEIEITVTGAVGVNAWHQAVLEGLLVQYDDPND